MDSAKMDQKYLKEKEISFDSQYFKKNPENSQKQNLILLLTKHSSEFTWM